MVVVPNHVSKSWDDPPSSPPGSLFPSLFKPSKLPSKVVAMITRLALRSKVLASKTGIPAASSTNKYLPVSVDGKDWFNAG